MISGSSNKTIEEELTVVTKTMPIGIAKVLYPFAHIFGKPKELPPHRQFDHQINLKEGAQPICLRLYMYGALQKDVIEKLT